MSRVERRATALALALGMGCAAKPSEPVAASEPVVSEPTQLATEIEPTPEPAITEAEAHVEQHLVEPSVAPAIDGCGHTLEQVQKAFQQWHDCHPHEREIAIRPDATALHADARALVRDVLRGIERDEPGGPGYVFITGGPGGLLVQAALREGGVDCGHIYAWPEETGNVVGVDYVCGVCCLL